MGQNTSHISQILDTAKICFQKINTSVEQDLIDVTALLLPAQSVSI